MLPRQAPRALDLLGAELASSSRQRALSTLRGFCGWLVRRQHLPANPCDAPELTVKRSSSGEVLSFRPDDVERLVAAAAPPPPNVRSAWPTRDVATVETLAHCGVRVSELIGLTVASIERERQQVLLKVRAGAKGGKPRNVPIPRRTLAAVDAYLDERAQLYGATPDRSTLSVRHDGSPLTQQLVDRTLRRLARIAGVTPPEGAMAHALRHTYGMDLAMRGSRAAGVPVDLADDDGLRIWTPILGPASVLLARLLLAESGRRWHIADVAGQLGIGTEYAQRVVRRLAQFGWLEASADGSNDGGAVTYHVLAASTLKADHLEPLHPELTARYARLSGLVGRPP